MKKLTMLFALLFFGIILRAQAPLIGVDSTSGCAPLGLTFTNLDTTNAGLNWTFNGGTPSFSTETIQEVIFENPGHFLVELTNPDSTIVQQLWIDVLSSGITSFSTDVNGNTVHFSNPNYSPSFQWVFGDGSTSQDKNPVHTYNNPGSYTVSLNYQNACGEFYTSSTVTIDTIITPTPQIAQNAYSGCAPLTVSFWQLNITNPNDWTWYFEGGNPSTSTAPNPTVVFDQTGDYTVYLVSTSGDTLTSQVTVGNDSIPDFETDIYGSLVFLTAQTSSTSDYLWDCGDGTTGTGFSFHHRYSATGTYTVTLTITSICGNIVTTTQDITITDGIGVDSTSGCAPLTLTFNKLNPQSSSYWEFSGADPSSSTATTQEVVFANPGNYSVTLFDANATPIQQLWVFVSSSSINPFSNNVAGNLVNFSNNNNTTNLSWDFGDGTTSYQPNPSHIYESTGDFLVTLSITTPCGVLTTLDTITITSLDAPIVPIDTSVTEFVRNWVTGNKQGITNVTGQFTPQSIGTFNNFATDAIELDKGVILSTGDIMDAIGPNNTGSEGISLDIPGDMTLQAYTTGITYDATFIEFDFVPSTNIINFSYVFASEEYPEFVNTGYNDVFGFFISGPGIVGEQNIALLPGVNTPVTIDNVNDSLNNMYYKSNVPPNAIAPDLLQYDGLTVPLIAEAIVLPTETYHIKMGVSDVQDRIYDSAVFLKANSFQSKPLVFNFDHTEGNYEEVVYEDSTSLKISVTLPFPAQKDFTYHFSFSGDAQIGTDYIAPQSFTFPQGEMSASFKIKALADNDVEDDETIQLVILETQDTVSISIKDRTALGHQAPTQITKISFTPNPAHDNFALPQGIVAESVELYTLSGKRVITYHDHFDKMDISLLPAGMYSVLVHSSEKDSVGKLKIE